MDIDMGKIDELLEITRENNKILRGMRSTQRWNSFITFVYWVIILGSVFGTYYYFQPLIQKYTNIFQTSVGVLQKVQENINPIQTDIKTVKKIIGK